MVVYWFLGKETVQGHGCFKCTIAMAYGIINFFPQNEYTFDFARYPLGPIHQLSIKFLSKPCRHLAITDTPIICRAVKSLVKIKYQYGLQLFRILTDSLNSVHKTGVDYNFYYYSEINAL